MAKVQIGVKAYKPRLFFTAKRKSEITQAFDVSLHPFIERITNIKAEEFKEYIDLLRTYPFPESEYLVLPANLPAIQQALECHLRFCISFVRPHLRKSDIKNKVQQLQALKRGNTIDAAGLTCAANWGLLAGITAYCSEVVDYERSFSSFVFMFIKTYILNYLTDQTGESLRGSFLGKEHREAYYQEKLLSLQ